MASVKKREGRISVDLLDLKPAWLAWCEAQALEPSDAFRQVVAKLTTAGPPKSGGRQTAHGEPERPVKRLKVPLTASELAGLQAVAEAEGFSVPRLLVALARHRLTGQAQFGQHELVALATSNGRLLSLGRNLNQIARAFNSVTGDRSGLQEEIEQLSEAVRSHAARVADLMAANTQRWRILP